MTPTEAMDTATIYDNQVLGKYYIFFVFDLTTLGFLRTCLLRSASIPISLVVQHLIATISLVVQLSREPI